MPFLIGLALVLTANKCLKVQTGTLEGSIGLFEGNCQPSPGVPPCEPSPISATIYISQPSESFDEALLVDSTISNGDGSYQIKLAAGRYSLFLRDGDEIFCPGF